MTTHTVYPVGKAVKTSARGKGKKFKKIAINIGAWFGIVAAITLMVLLMMKLHVVSI